MQNCRNILFELKSISHLLKRFLGASSMCGNCEGLTGVRMAMIGFIGENSLKGDVFQKDIEAEFEIRRSTATVMLKQLEKDGYITKTSVEKDARLKKLALTPMAVDICKDVAKDLSELSLKMLSGLDENEKEVLFRSIEKIKNNLKDIK